MQVNDLNPIFEHHKLEPLLVGLLAGLAVGPLASLLALRRSDPDKAGQTVLVGEDGALTVCIFETCRVAEPSPVIGRGLRDVVRCAVSKPPEAASRRRARRDR